MVLLPTNLSAVACGQTDVSSRPSRAPRCPPPGADSWNALLVGLCAAHEGQHGLLWCPGRLAGGIGTHTTYVDPQANTAQETERCPLRQPRSTLAHQIGQACMAAHALPRTWHTNSSGK